MEFNVKYWPTHAEGMVAVGVLRTGEVPTTSMGVLPEPVQPLLSVTVAVYLKVDVPAVAPDIVAVVLALVVLDVGLTVVLPGDVTTAVAQA